MTFYVYRMYDKTNRLLYVGSTGDAKRRLLEHIGSSPFWEEVCAMGFDRFETRSEAKQAEDYQIWNEEPVYNKIGQNPKAKSDQEYISQYNSNFDKDILSRSTLKRRPNGELPWGPAARAERRQQLRKNGKL